jgi:hypothetical protein
MKGMGCYHSFLEFSLWYFLCFKTPAKPALRQLKKIKITEIKKVANAAGELL